MKLAIHQPQYHPWIHYYRKIANADTFVYLNEVQFQKNGMQNRNRIKTACGEQWITVPVQKPYGKKISEVECSGNHWKMKHSRTIEQNYNDSIELFDHLYGEVYRGACGKISDINCKIIDKTCDYFGIQTEKILQGNLNVGGEKSDLILNICRKLKCNTYVSGQGGLSYLDMEAFQANNIKIEVIEAIPFKYPQYHKKSGFIGGLSALDFILNARFSWDNYIKF